MYIYWLYVGIVLFLNVKPEVCVMSVKHVYNEGNVERDTSLPLTRRPKRSKSDETNTSEVTLIQTEGGIKQRLRINSGKNNKSAKVGLKSAIEGSDKGIRSFLIPMIKEHTTNAEGNRCVNADGTQQVVQTIAQVSNFPRKRNFFEDVCQEVSETVSADSIFIQQKPLKQTHIDKTMAGRYKGQESTSATLVSNPDLNMNGKGEIAAQGQGLDYTEHDKVPELGANSQLKQPGNASPPNNQQKIISAEQVVTQDSPNRDIEAVPNHDKGSKHENPRIQELNELIKRRDSAEAGSMQHMLLNLQIDIKKDNIEMMQKIDNVANISDRLSTEVATLKSNKIEMERSITNLQETQEEEAGKLEKTNTAVAELTDQVRILQGVVQKQSQTSSLIKQRSDANYYQEIKDELFISGLDEDNEESETETAQMVTNFFSQTMKITQAIIVNKATRIGKANPRTVLVKLKNSNDKKHIFQNAKELRDARNSTDGKYYVNNHLTQEASERNRKFRILMKLNDAQVGGTKLDMKIKSGELMVNGRPFNFPPIVPDIHETVFPLDKKHVDKIKLDKGAIQKRGNCRFIGYSAEIKNLGDVRAAYTKVCRLNANALHVMCAFRLPGADVLRNRGYEDNGEHGGGRILFNLLEENDIFHRAIFVVRHYGNRHIGPARFSLIAMAVKSVFTLASFNSILNEHQFIRKEPKDPSSNVPDNKPSPGYAAVASPRLFPNKLSSWGSSESVTSASNEYPQVALEANKQRVLRPRAGSVGSKTTSAHA